MDKLFNSVVRNEAYEKIQPFSVNVGHRSRLRSDCPYTDINNSLTQQEVKQFLAKVYEKPQNQDKTLRYLPEKQVNHRKLSEMAMMRNIFKSEDDDDLT